MSAVPLLGEISLPHVQRIEHRFDGGFERVRVAGLPGELIQRVRLIHRHGQKRERIGREERITAQSRIAQGAIE